MCKLRLSDGKGKMPQRGNMMRVALTKICSAAMAVALACALAGCAQGESASSTSASDEVNREVIEQVSLLQGLLQGDYYGSVSIAELKQHGDTGGHAALDK